jgi:predicted Fe-S protein YdhL (DUF1289 family)
MARAVDDEMLQTDSPCVGVCSTTFGDEFCFGCKRRFDEVIKWNGLSDEEKDRINRRLLELCS